MPCSERRGRRSAWRAAASALVAIALLAVAAIAEAHKASDSYLQLTAGPARLDARWDIALRDLDVAIDLDGDGDGKLTWGEVRTAWPRIEAYALQRLRIEGCALTATGRGLERRNDGAYAVLHLSSPCTLPMAPRIVYSLFADVDPTHRGLGLATALKVAQALELRDAGWRSVVTQNMEGNDAILASNRTLGFVRAMGKRNLTLDY